MVDRAMQALHLLALEPVSETCADSHSYGFRRDRSTADAIEQCFTALAKKTSSQWILEGDIRACFDTIQHSTLLDKIAKRIQDPQVLRLVKQVIKAAGKIGVPQGGPFSPLAANIYLNEIDWMFDEIRRKTAQGPYEAVNYHRFADDIVITVSGHHTKRGWAERALLRLREQLVPLGVELNTEKTTVVDTLHGDAFGFLGFDLRRVRKRAGNGYFIRS
ncbi:RNA-directed DNA polymerase [Caballeronia calidae]|uniref:RNA-directed DNA polymerase n=1 Tax=Caballeronia calidae TaxID=1777139 RepID=A0A158EJS0_9BURK|nr:reverse transcriptase domain-containing protein [Caballeronia calidae]SAL06656.1 RNA-directed DNA polymerase [Caballeronia calidae]